jgi:predicted metalloprotease
VTFNEGARIDPGRVQRRGRSAGGMVAVGGGAGGLLVVVLFLVIQLLGGGSLTDLGGVGNAPEDQTQAQDFAERCTTGADANRDTDCRVAGTIVSLDDYWVSALPAAGMDLRFPGVVIFDEQTNSGCGTASSAMGPFYCPPDETIYLDATFFAQLESEYGASGGPLAQMYVVAHEYGHHLQNQLGVFDIADRSGTGPDSDSVKVELMADCLAGVWAGHAATTEDASGTTLLQPLTQQDVNDALSAAGAVGDDRIQEATQGEVTPHTFSHGTAEQRQEAFITGYENGTVAACDTFGVLN